MDGTTKEGKASIDTLSSTSKASVLSEDKESIADDFIKVKYPCRSHSSLAAKPREIALDSHNQVRGQLLHRSMSTAETPRQVGAATSQPTLKQNTVPQPQEMYVHVTPRIQENASRSEVDVPDTSKWFLLEGFSPRIGDVSPQMPNHSSTKASGVARGNFKPSDGMKTPMKLSLSFNLQRSRSKDQLPHRSMSTAETPCQGGAVTSQRTLKQNTVPQPQEMYAHVTPKIHENASRSEVDVLDASKWFLVEGFSPRMADVSPQMPNRSSINASGVVRGNFKPSNKVKTPLKPSLSFNLKRPRSEDQVPHRSMSTAETPRQGGAFTPRIQENASRSEVDVPDTSKWFLLEGFSPRMVDVPPQMPNRSSINAKVTPDMCHRYLAHKPCIKDPCTFPHGQLKSTMWTTEQQEGVYEARYRHSK